MSTEKVRQRDAQAAVLRARGRTYQEIAQELHYGGSSSAFDACRRALDRSVKLATEEARELESIKLDRAEAALVAVIESPPPTVQLGKIVLGVDGAPVPDAAAVTAAVRALVAVAGRRAKLYGLDAATRADTTVITEDLVDLRIRELENEIATREAEAAGQLDSGPRGLPS